MLWGAYGANVVHMSILQEYMAAAIGVEVGVYRQVSDSFHIYLNPVWDKVKHIEINPYTYRDMVNPYDTLENYKHIPLFTDTDNLNGDLDRFFNTTPAYCNKDGWANSMFPDIAIPMREAYSYYKEKDFRSSFEIIYSIKALDWRTACLDWIRKREESFISKTEKGETYE
jgi:hypothetical protein